LGGPVFDTQKLDWLNGRYLRESLSDDEFLQRFSEWAFQPEKIREMVPLVKPRVEKFSDLAPLAAFFFSGLPAITPEHFAHKTLDAESSRRVLQFVAWRVESLKAWHRDRIEQAFVELAASLDLKIRDFLFPVFIAIAGSPVSTSVIDSIAILGLDMTRARLRHALEVLGGVSKKEAKRLEKEYAGLRNEGG